MKFSEIFHSIQGEGNLVGVPSVFFRTSFCNLRCIWCDTPYTSWSPENRDISVGDAAAAIRAFGCRHVVITGGEPFIQHRELAELCSLLHTVGHHLTIETNATVYARVSADLISMSPKLSNSNPDAGNRFLPLHESKRIQPEVIRAFLENYDCQVKFVVEHPADLAEIRALADSVPIPTDAVVLMPQGRTPAETHPKLEWLADICVREGYRLSPRLHVDIWGDKRGV